MEKMSGMLMAGLVWQQQPHFDKTELFCDSQSSENGLGRNIFIVILICA